MSTPTATGQREGRAGLTYVVFRREFRAPIGSWSGDPASGSVDFRMTAEAEDAPIEPHRILECDPPRRLVTESASPEDDATVWRLEVDLVEEGGVTTFTFGQRVQDGLSVESVGPGWDYYLDRLVAAEAGDDVGDVAWDDYYPALAEHYRSAFS